MKKRLTYNNGIGWIKAEEKGGVLYINRTAHIRAWQKLNSGFAVVKYDTDKEVKDACNGKIYQKRTL